LINHANVEITFAHSKSQAGKPVYATHTDLLGDTDLIFSGEEVQTLLNDEKLNAIFLCSGHGESKKFLDEYAVSDNIKIIDLSTDFRNESDGFVYGLPELQREKIKAATKIANPGCFATSIELAILPLANAGSN
jgi:N-acetyl-gamma-glutamyl-phosphate reductase